MKNSIYNPKTNLNYILRQKKDSSGRRGQIKGLASGDGGGNNMGLVILLVIAAAIIYFIVL